MAEPPIERASRRRLPVRARATLALGAILSGLILLTTGAILAVVLFGPGVLSYGSTFPMLFAEGGNAEGEGGNAEIRYCPSGGRLETCANPTSMPIDVMQDPPDPFQRVLVWAIVIVTVIVLVLAVFAAWKFVGRMLRPLGRIGAAAESVARGRLDHRIGLVGPADEITDVTDTFDRMIAELERTIGQYERFAANASHELRTPLATTRTMLDVALQRPGPPDRLLLERLRATNERSIETVDALLDLAGVAAERRGTGQVPFASLVNDVVDDLRPRFAVAGAEVRTRLDPVELPGDEALLRRLVANLVENAALHGDSALGIDVRVVAAGDVVRLEVENGGDDLAALELAGLTEPFVRGAGRTRGAGTGLGLAIVEAIVRRHEGVLELAARPGGGLRVRVSLPAARTPVAGRAPGRRRVSSPSTRP